MTLELKPRVAMMSAEAFVRYASQRYGKEFGRLKVWFDVSLVSLAIILSLIISSHIQGVREGSVVAAVVTGYIVTFMNTRLLTRRTLGRVRSLIKV